ncbi:MAG TPA: ROK family protein [Nitriliruptorales bacterium]
MPTVGVDLGGTNVVALVLDQDDQVLGRTTMRTPRTEDRGAVLEVMEAAIHDALSRADLSIGQVDAIGVGTPGVVVDGSVGGASNVAGWYERFALSTHFAEQVGIPVRVSNDVNAAAIGEHRLGAGQGYEDVLVIFVGTGVGGGLILQGELFEGKFGGAGEFGHTVVVRGGAVCPCGRRGCVEAYAGRRAMAQKAERLVAAGRETILFDVMDAQDKNRPSSGVFRDALDKGDPMAADLIDEAVEALGAGVGSAVNLLDVELVVIGGGLADKLAPQFIGRIEAAARPHLFLQPPHVGFAPAALGDQAGALGAALLARHIP